MECESGGRRSWVKGHGIVERIRHDCECCGATESGFGLREKSSASGAGGVGLRKRVVRTVASLSADNVVGTAASLLGHDALGSRLDSLWQFSFKRTSSLLRTGSSTLKRRQLAFGAERGGISAPRFERELLGVSDDAHVASEPTLRLNSVVDNELIHVSREDFKEQGATSSPMLRKDSPRHGDIQREVRRFVRPVSLPNLLSQDSNHEIVVHCCPEVPGTAKDSVRQRASNDADETNPIRGAHVTPNEPQELLNSCSEVQRSSWDFRVMASVKCQNRNLTSTDVIGTIAFERKNEYFATGGIARKIRVYAYSSLASAVTQFVDEDEDGDEDEEEEGDSAEYFKQRRLRKRRNSTADIDHTRCCVREVCTPAKLSSIQWHQERPNLIACGDYDGVVAEWDVERACAVSERDENGGQRIWSIDYSKDFPDLVASASDDGTVRLWDRSSDKSVAMLSPPPPYSSICCAEFGPVSSSLIALASADSNVYLYDTRWLATPLLILAHHKRAASYVRFLNRHSLVSSSIDSSVKLWDISKPHGAKPGHHLPVRSFGSHYNVRNFTGLSVRSEGGLIACGSETNQAFVYDSQSSSNSPALTHSFDYNLGLGFGHSNPNLGALGGEELHSQGTNSEHPEGGGSSGLIVSAVCWRMEPNDCTLVAANSDGVLRILSGSISKLG